MCSLSGKKTVIVISGPSGSGKSTLGKLLESKYSKIFSEKKIIFLDSDDFHSAESKANMASGIGLTDEDRFTWLARLKEVIRNELDESFEMIILACSALKKAYRDHLRELKTEKQARIVFVVLKLERDLLLERLRQRQGHFAGPALLNSQLQSFEIPTEKEVQENDDIYLSIVTKDINAESLGDLVMAQLTQVS